MRTTGVSSIAMFYGIDERREYRARQRIVFPPNLGVPLNAKYPVVARVVNHGLDDSVRRPCDRRQVVSEPFDGLVMVTVDRRRRPARKLGYQRPIENVDLVTMSDEDIALRVLYREISQEAGWSSGEFSR